MKKIAFISTIGGFGGSEILWLSTAALAAKAGHDVWACCSDTHRSKSLTQNAAKAGVKFAFREPVKTARISRMLDRVRRKLVKPNPFRGLASFNPDAIVINGDDVGVLAHPDLISLIHKMGTPYIHIAHGCGGFVSKPQRNLAEQYFGRAKWNCFVAEPTLRSTERHVASKIPNARIVRNTVILTHNYNDAMAFPDDSKNVQLATVSRLNCHTKGHDYLLQTLADSDLKKFDWHLNIYGDGEHSDLIAALAKHFNLQDRVSLMGHSNDISSIWEKNHLHVMPSITESAPIALVEAMLCGRPSVVTNVGGVGEWVIEGETGFKSENANSWLLGPTLKRAFENQDRWREIGKNAHSHATELIGRPEEDFLAIILD